MILSKAPKKKHPRRREKVLVVLHGDFFVEVFAERHVDVRIVHRIALEHSSPANEILTERILELSLPRAYRNVFAPGNRRAARMHERKTVVDFVDREWHRYAMHSLSGIRAFIAEARQEDRKTNPRREKIA